MRTLLSRLGKTTLVGVFLALTLVIAGVGAMTYYANRSPIPDPGHHEAAERPITILDAKGGEIAYIVPEQGAVDVVDSHNIAPIMKKAAIAAEDGSFEHNLGFSPRRIVGAALGHIKGNSSAGGASTITQQLIKNTVGSSELSAQRKIKEIFSAIKLSAQWDKDAIITAYLNTIYFGRGATGIENAAKAYFGKHALELSPEESALLAGVIQAPSVHDPAVNESSAQSRFRYVMGEMAKHNFVDPERAQRARMPHTIPPAPIEVSRGLEGPGGHIASKVLQELDSRGFSKEKLHATGAVITTTIDPDRNAVIVSKASQAAAAHGVSIGVASVNRYGEIVGMWGGDNGLGYDNATNGHMSGSTFKVFTLAAYLEKGGSIHDPFSSALYQLGPGHTVFNSGGMTCGTCSAADALKMSLNTSFMRIVDATDGKAATVRNVARAMGVDAPLHDGDDNETVNPTITLGVYDTSPLHLAAGLSTIANGGEYADTHIVRNVRSHLGQPVYTHRRVEVRAISAETASAVSTAMAPIGAYSNGNGLADGTDRIKTGTVEHPNGMNKDALTIGFSTAGDRVSTAVWVGTPNGGPVVSDVTGATIWGAQLPAQLWKSIMEAIHIA